MTVLFEYLATLAEKPLGTVVHIGAGSGAVLECYAALKPARVILLEGDPDTAAELLRSAAQCPWAEVLAHPVGATGGPLEWRRYNLRRLNGPLQSGVLHSFYPRLRLVESRTVNARALSEVLAEVQVAAWAGGINVLVLDVPGQEAALLDSLPHEALIQFDAVLLCGSREALPAWGATAEQAVNQLKRACFDTVAAEFDQEPLWPVTLLRFNAQRHQTELLEQRLGGQLAALDEANEALKDLQTHFDAVSEAKAAADLTAADRASQIERLNQGKAHAEQAANERAAQIEQLAVLLDEQNALAAERQAQLQALTQAHAELERVAHERQGQVEALSQGKAQAEQTTHERAAQIEQLTGLRDEQAALAADREAQLQALMQAHAELERTANERQGQVEAISQGKAQAEQTAHERAGQIEQLTGSRDEQATLAAERQAQLQALTQAHDERGRLHDHAARAAESLHEANAKLKAESDALQAANAQLRKKAEDLETAHAGMLQQAADADSRQRLLDNEILKAQAQLELIKDVLIREKNF